MRPCDSSYDRMCSASARAARKFVDTATAKVGDVLDLDAWEKLDDMAARTILDELAERGLRLDVDSWGVAVVAIEE